jgi:hypothetical protein
MAEVSGWWLDLLHHPEDDLRLHQPALHKIHLQELAPNLKQIPAKKELWASLNS